MAKLPDITNKELIAALTKIGFEIVRQKGSHVRMKHEDGRVVTVPVHSGKTLGKEKTCFSKSCEMSILQKRS